MNDILKYVREESVVSSDECDKMSKQNRVAPWD